MKPVKPSDVLSRFKLKRAVSLAALGLLLFPLSAQAQYYGRGYGPYVVSPYGGYDGGGRYVVPPDGGPPPPGPYGGPYGGPPLYGPYDAGPGGPPPGPAYGEYAPPPRPGPRPSPYDGPPGLPSGQRGPSASPPGPGPSGGPGGAGPVSLDMIQGRIKAAGYRLIAPPRQKGNIYLAEVEDSKSVRHRLVYDANDGHLIQNTPLGPVKKTGGPGGPLPSEQSKAPGGAGPTGGEPADQAKSVPPSTPAPPPPAPHGDEPPPPAAVDPVPAPRSELTDRPPRMAEEDSPKPTPISIAIPYPDSISFPFPFTRTPNCRAQDFIVIDPLWYLRELAPVCGGTTF